MNKISEFHMLPTYIPHLLLFYKVKSFHLSMEDLSEYFFNSWSYYILYLYRVSQKNVYTLKITVNDVFN